MGNIYDTIRALGFSQVGSKTQVRFKDGRILDCTLEAYSKRKGTATISYEQDGQKYISELILKNQDGTPAGSDDSDGEYPSAVFTASGKLVHLFA